MEYLTGGLLRWLLRLLQHAEVPNLTHSEPNLPLGCKKKTHVTIILQNILTTFAQYIWFVKFIYLYSSSK